MKAKPHTVTVQIGNSDDRLPQRRWWEFVRTVDHKIQRMGKVWFSGGSASDAPWQNYCWVADMWTMDDLASFLKQTAAEFDQGSIALTVGATELVCPD